jgi:hypothetical protein
MNENPSKNRLPLIIGGSVGLIVICLCLAVAGGAAAFMFLGPRSETVAETPAVSVEYVLDVSQRMSLTAQGAAVSRLELAQGAMAEMARATPADAWSGLRVFGSGAQTGACRDTDLLLPLAAGNQNRIATELVGLQTGLSSDAALAEAMIAAIRNLAEGQGVRSLVVVTGGQDDCQAEAAQLVAEEAARAGIELRTFVIGVQITAEEQAAIKRIAEASGDGVYLDAQDEVSLRQAFRAVQAYIQSPTAETFTAVETTAVALEQGQTAALPTPIPPSSTPEAGEPEPAVTTTPSPTPPVVATTPSDTAAMGETACDHPYFPMRTGATWTYRLSDAGETMTMIWTVTGVTGDRNNAEATIRAEFDGFTTTYTWQCTPEGIVSFDFHAFNFDEFEFEMEDMSYSTEFSDQSGVTLPAPGQMRQGFSWNNGFTMRTTIAMAGLALTYDFTNSESFTITGEESVTVPAGTFNALVVEMVGNSSASSSMMPEMNMAFGSSGTHWYGRGVGWLRSVTITDGERSTMELVSYSIP